MHEEALFRRLRNVLDELGRAEPTSRITVARLRVGALSHVTEAKLREAWPRLSAGTGATGARLEVEVGSDPLAKDADAVLLVSVDREEPGALGAGREPGASSKEVSRASG